MSWQRRWWRGIWGGCEEQTMLWAWRPPTWSLRWTSSSSFSMGQLIIRTWTASWRWWSLISVFGATFWIGAILFIFDAILLSFGVTFKIGAILLIFGAIYYFLGPRFELVPFYLFLGGRFINSIFSTCSQIYNKSDGNFQIFHSETNVFFENVFEMG